MAEVHHLMSERDVRLTCPYCRIDVKDLKGWKSEFSGNSQYISANCDKCKRPIRLKVNCNGSGHDSWDEQEGLENLKNLDDRIGDV